MSANYPIRGLHIIAMMPCHKASEGGLASELVSELVHTSRAVSFSLFLEKTPSSDRSLRRRVRENSVF